MNGNAMGNIIRNIACIYCHSPFCLVFLINLKICNWIAIKWMGLWNTSKNELLLTLVNWKKNQENTLISIQFPDGASKTQALDLETSSALNSVQMDFNEFEVKMLVFK